MAKRKNSTALFEVMHNDKRPAPRSPLFGGGGGGGGIGLGSWWPFGRKNENDPTAGANSPSVTHVTENDPTESVYDPTMPAMSTAALVRSSAPAPMYIEMDSHGSDDPTRRTRFNVSVDAEHQLIRLNMSYTSAAVAGFTVAVALALAFILGRHGARHAIPALAEQTTEQLRRQPAQPGVMDIQPDEPTPAVHAAAPTPAGNRIAEPITAAAAATKPPAANAANEPKPPQNNRLRDANRSVGLNYVVIQNYFDDEKAATEARDVLLKKGILCTVERGPEGWAPTKWFSVVGIDGFERTKRDPEYLAYVESIMKVSKEYAGNSKFKQFDPQPFKWREAKPAGN